MKLDEAREAAQRESEEHQLVMAVYRDPYDEHEALPENQYGYMPKAGMYIFPYHELVETIGDT